MSRIADRIRAYVNDYSVAEHYGEWGILRPDQRRQIRELCDTCDMFERTADELARKQREGANISGYPSLFECSVCHWRDYDTYTGDTSEYNYCPNCGAKMKGA